MRTMMAASPSSRIGLCERLEESPPKCLPTSDTSVNFDCSICLELPYDPVVTMCGHLFCWPCLHRWISLQPICQECPVCKACVKDKIIPLYGRGKAGFISTEMDHLSEVPPRPSAHQSYVDAGNTPQSATLQHQGFIPQRIHGNIGGHSTHSVIAPGLFPTLFGIDMITSPEYNGGIPFGTAFNVPEQARSLAIRARTSQQWLNAQKESLLYWILFVVGCYGSVWFLLF